MRNDLIRLKLTLLSLVLLTACAPRAVHRNYNIPLACLTSDVRLLDCDSASPPEHCKKSLMHYKRGCEEIVLR